MTPVVSAGLPRLSLEMLLNVGAVAGLCAVLVAGYVFQFALGELPCPLCTLQRVAFVFATVGFLMNIRIGARPLHYAAVLAAAVLGMTISGRQVLLHVTPGTGAYGSAVLGLHFYTWAFLIFGAMIPATALLLAVHRPGPAVALIHGPLVNAVGWTAVALCMCNALTIFLQCGPIECIDDPVTWWVSGFWR